MYKYVHTKVPTSILTWPLRPPSPPPPPGGIQRQSSQRKIQGILITVVVNIPVGTGGTGPRVLISFCFTYYTSWNFGGLQDSQAEGPSQRARELQCALHRVINWMLCFAFTGDACSLTAEAYGGKFGVILAANLLCRLPKPRAFLDSLPDLLVPGGLLVMPSPYTWLESYTRKEDWIGGYTDAEGFALVPHSVDLECIWSMMWSQSKLGG